MTMHAKLYSISGAVDDIIESKDLLIVIEIHGIIESQIMLRSAGFDDEGKLCDTSPEDFGAGTFYTEEEINEFGTGLLWENEVLDRLESLLYWAKLGKAPIGPEEASALCALAEVKIKYAEH